MIADRPWRLLWRRAGDKWREYDRYCHEEDALLQACLLECDIGPNVLEVWVKKEGPAENDQPPAPETTSRTATPPLRRS